MSKKELEDKITHIVRHLPPMPQNLERLLSLVADLRKNQKQICELIQNDSILCAELLHIANSDCYDSAVPIETFEDAVKKVGIEPLIELVCVFYADKAVEKDFAPLKNLRQYFVHSRQISLGCRAIAQVAGQSPQTQKLYSVAGLIHDIGRLVLMLATNSITASFMGTSPEEFLSIIHDEHELAGINHCEIGEKICRNWNFSPTLCEGVLRHHTPVIAENTSMPGSVIFLAHFVTASDMTGNILARMAPIEKMMADLGITSKDFEKAAKMYSVMN